VARRLAENDPEWEASYDRIVRLKREGKGAALGHLDQ